MLGPGWQRGRWIAGLAAAALVGGCGPEAATVPPGAQVVHVGAIAETISLVPAQVTAGTIYLALDPSTDSVFVFLASRAAGDVPGPLTQDDVARLARGDTQGTAMDAFSLLGCDEARRSAERGRLAVPGGCGNVFTIDVGPGLVAFMVESPDSLASGTKAPIAVLTVSR